jgi:(heptosyl)LPS beta-1,4-glucosyltransferase
MANTISVIINTLNEEAHIASAIASVKEASEIIVCDMHSDDKTAEIAKKLGAKVVTHKRVGYVEPARNFAISQAKNDWILILDADEVVTDDLWKMLVEIAARGDIDYVEIPRKNLIFNKWMIGSMWWPDYNIRFFKKNAVIWSDRIHSKPQTKGQGTTLPAKEQLAFIHYHYTSVDQFLTRLNRYTSIQADHLVEDGYVFRWQDVIEKPLGEFLSRYFANNGYKDGLHGLALGLLQGLSFLVMYLKVWEKEKFNEKNISVQEVEKLYKKSGKDVSYWFHYVQLSDNPVKRMLQKVKSKI